MVVYRSMLDKINSYNLNLNSIYYGTTLIWTHDGISSEGFWHYKYSNIPRFFESNINIVEPTIVSSSAVLDNSYILNNLSYNIPDIVQEYNLIEYSYSRYNSNDIGIYDSKLNTNYDSNIIINIPTIVSESAVIDESYILNVLSYNIPDSIAINNLLEYNSSDYSINDIGIYDSKLITNYNSGIIYIEPTIVSSSAVLDESYILNVLSYNIPDIITINNLLEYNSNDYSIDEIGIYDSKLITNYTSNINIIIPTIVSESAVLDNSFIFNILEIEELDIRIQPVMFLNFPSDYNIISEIETEYNLIEYNSSNMSSIYVA